MTRKNKKWDYDSFKEYADKLLNSPNQRSQKRGRNLLHFFNKYKSQGYSKDEAANKALASAQQSIAKKKAHQAKKSGNQSKKDRWNSVWGKASGQHQLQNYTYSQSQDSGSGGGGSGGGRGGSSGSGGGGTPPTNPPNNPWWEKHDLFEQIIKGLLIWFLITAIGWVISNLVWHGIIGNFWWFMIGGFGIGFSVMNFAPESAAFQISRATMRGIGIYFVGVSAWVVYPLAGLLVTFFGYLSLPARAEGGMQYESALAGVRFMLGIVLTFFVYNMIGGNFLIRWSLTLIVAGFFAALPEITGAQSGGVRGRLSVIVNAGTEENQMGSRLMSVMTCGAGTAMGILHFLLNDPSPFPMFTFSLFGLVAVVTAYSTPASVRGMAGMPYVLVIFFVTGLIFPGVVGEAFFGAWWPTIHENVMETFGPVSQSMSDSLQTFKFGFNCLRDPVGCARRWEPSSKTEKGIYAVDINKVDPIIPKIKKYPTQNNPQKVKVMIEIENKGKRTSEDIKLQLLDPYVPDSAIVGKPKEIACNNKMISGKKNCTIDKLYPGEMRQISATYEITGPESLLPEEFKVDQLKPWKWPSHLKENVGKVKGGKVGKLKPGDFIKLPAVVSYSYSANATLDVEVWDNAYYEEMHLKDKVDPHYVQSKDTGGVIGVGLSADIKQPVRDTMPRVPIFISLKNRGNGYVPKNGLTRAEVKIDGLGNITSNENKKGDNTCNMGEEYKNLNDSLPIEQDKSAKDVCTIDIVDLPGPNVTKRTFGVNGYTEYKYKVGNQGKIKLAFSAVKCTCQSVDGEEPKEKNPTVYDPCQCVEACGGQKFVDEKEGKCVR